jgi:hypothetical protein
MFRVAVEELSEIGFGARCCGFTPLRAPAAVVLDTLEMRKSSPAYQLSGEMPARGQDAGSVQNLLMVKKRIYTDSAGIRSCSMTRASDGIAR